MDGDVIHFEPVREASIFPMVFVKSMTVFAIALPLTLATIAPAAATSFDPAKCIIAAAALVPHSPATTIKSAKVRPMTPAEAKNWPQGGAWVDVDVAALGVEAVYTFMCGTNGDGRTNTWLMK